MPISPFIKPFHEIGLSDRSTVGGKGASLGELTRAGIRVPAGFVVTIAAFEQCLAAVDPHGSIGGEIEALSADNLPAIARVSQATRERLEAAVIPGQLQSEIAAQYELLRSEFVSTPCDEPVAVRSSATSEDSADASFAGLQDTYLWVRGAEPVLAHVRKCWASLYAVESIAYRRRKKLPEAGLAMAVVVQRMIDARTSGVLFTRSPATGDRSVVVVEASWGLGSAVVSGEVTPDKFTIGKVTGEIVTRTVSTKLRLHRPNPNGSGVLDELVPAEQQNIACLSDDELHVLVEIAKRAERHYGCAQDIEWAISCGATTTEKNIFLLQSRPETAWAAKEARPVATPKSRSFDHVFSLLGGGASKK